MLVSWRRGYRCAQEYSFLRQSCRGRSLAPAGLVVRGSTPPTRACNSPSISPAAPAFQRAFETAPWKGLLIGSDRAVSLSRHRNIAVSSKTAVKPNSGSLKCCERPWRRHHEHDGPQSRRDPPRRNGSRKRRREARPNGSGVTPTAFRETSSGAEQLLSWRCAQIGAHHVGDFGCNDLTTQVHA